MNHKRKYKPRALVFLSLMLSLSENWEYTTNGLASICKDGIDSISNCIKEPESAIKQCKK